MESIKDVHIEFYSYKKSLEGDMTVASLIISHGGTGGCMCEGLVLSPDPTLSRGKGSGDH